MEKNLAQDRAAPPVHETRAYETWEGVDIHAVESQPWVRGTSLEAPEARPGFSQRWIRVGTMGQDDPTNTARKFREGWRPRPASTLPAGFLTPTIAHGKWAGCIGVEGSLLCEIPTKLLGKRNAHFKERNDVTNRMIANEMQKHASPMATVTQERKTTTRMIPVMDD